jgi:hypothetical protein
VSLALSDATLESLLGQLLPGDSAFPSASILGLATTVRARLATLGGADAEARIAAALLTGDLAAIERDRPTLFDLLRRAVYLSYYEAPAVIAAIRGLGIDYRGAPQPRGYDLGRFDPAVDAPRHGRGRWKPTTETRRGNA